MSTVIDPLASENPTIRSAIDAVLVEGYQSGTRIQSVNTVAGTIFPFDLYSDPEYSYHPTLESTAKVALDTSASDLYQSYIEMLPILTTDTANRSEEHMSELQSL